MSEKPTRGLSIQHSRGPRQADEMEASNPFLYTIIETREGEPDQTVRLTREDARLLVKLIVEGL